MASPRVRRLLLDHETLTSRLGAWPLIQITGTAGMPPEIYRFTYNIRGLYVSREGEILERSVHVLEVNLSLGYPRRAPQCRMLTPVFHPNFDESMVCIGDFWAASEGLDDLIIRIGRMISYQEYNTKSPLNGLAAKWAAQNASLLPIDGRNIAPPLKDEASAGHIAADGGGPGASVSADGNASSNGGSEAVVAPVVTQSEVPVAPAGQIAASGDASASIDPWSQKISIE